MSTRYTGSVNPWVYLKWIYSSWHPEASSENPIDAQESAPNESIRVLLQRVAEAWLFVRY